MERLPRSPLLLVLSVSTLYHGDIFPVPALGELHHQHVSVSFVNFIVISAFHQNKIGSLEYFGAKLSFMDFTFTFITS